MPSITCDVLVLREKFKTNDKGFLETKNEVLLIKRKNEPFKDCWALPGGFMEIDETLVECAKRELKEETGIDVNESKLYFKKILDKVDRDSRGRVVSVVYMTHVSQKTIVNAGDDAKEYAWFEINNLPSNMAFDHKELFKNVL
jgi:8-oxo-dGTP diphosphatase